MAKKRKTAKPGKWERRKRKAYHLAEETWNEVLYILSQNKTI